MGTLFYYSIYSSLLLSVFYGVYCMIRRFFPAHGFRRMLLMLMVIISFVALPVGALVDMMNTDTVVMIPSGTIIVQPDRISVGTVWTLLLWAYVIGFTLMTAVIIAGLIRLYMIVRRGRSIGGDGYRIVLTDDERIAPFSIGNMVVMSCKDYVEYGDMILCHEMQHVKSRHWVDLAVVQSLSVVAWFNPVIYIVTRELRIIHEYSADAGVVSSGTDVKEYQMLLISKASGIAMPMFANCLNHGVLKKTYNCDE